MQNIIKNKLLSSIILLALGVLLIAAPVASLRTYVRIIGAVLLCGAAVRIVVHFLTKKEDRVPVSLVIGGVAAIFGVVLLIAAQPVINALNIIFGVLLILNSLFDLVIAVRLPAGKTVALILALIGVLLGILIVINPAAFASFATRIIGCVLVYDAVVGLVTALFARKTAKSNLLDK